MSTLLILTIFTVAIVLFFDYTNGFHDAANSIATVVSTGVLKPGQAVVFAAFFNFIAIFIFHLSVAATVGKGIVQPGVVDIHVVFGALIVGTILTVAAWKVHLPTLFLTVLVAMIIAIFLIQFGVLA